MPSRDLYQVPQRPEALQQSGLGGLAYWGDRKPPKNFADVFRAYATKETSGKGGSTKTRTTATLRLYGPIYDGWFGISARKVSQALDELGDVDAIVVRVNSPGGDAWEGMTILNMLRAHQAEVTAVVDGVAASAASYLVAGCDRTVMSPGTQMMIHDASALAYGPAETMAKAKVFLDSVSDSIAAIYADIAGGTDEAWRALMKETTWYTAKEAVAAGLADAVEVVKDAGETETAEDTEPDELESDVEDRFDLSMYPFAGRSHAPAPKPPAASAEGSTQTEGGTAVAVSDEQIADLRNKLGLADDADEATILATVEDVVDKATEPPAVTKPAEIPEGHVVIPAAKLADLEAGAKLATDTAAALQAKDRDAFLDANRSKFLPANRNAWAKEYDRDPEATKTHFASAPDIVPVSELGHAQGGDAEALAADADYLALFPDEAQPEKKGA